MPKPAFLILFFLFFIFSQPTYAARNVTISTDDSSLFGDEEGKISITPTGFSDGETIYIKGAFFQEGSTNYFGYTKKGDSWVKNGESTLNQNNIKIGSWDNKLVVKVDFQDSGYKGEGDYLFKVGFYYTTSGGNLSSVNWSSNNLAFAISEPDPTPEPTQTVQNSPSATPQVIQTAKIQSPLPSKFPTPSPSHDPKILGQSTQSATNSSYQIDNLIPEKPLVQSPDSKTTSSISDILISAGLILSGFSLGAYLWYKHLQH